MKRFSLFLSLCLLAVSAWAVDESDELFQQSCTSIMVGRSASTDGSVITSHTCDGRYRTWAYMEPAEDHAKGDLHTVYKNTMHTSFHGDTTGVRIAGMIPEARHTYAYLNTAYPCLNEKQLAIGETTFGGPDTLVNSNGMFLIEELERVALQRCDKARDAVLLIGDLVRTYGYGDGGECITIADKNEVWQMEILGEGPEKIGGIWAARRIPDDHVAVSANIPRIGTLDRKDKANFLCSDNIEKVAKRCGLWDGKGEFVFWKVFNCDYAEGRNFHDREFFILNALAPSLHLTRDMDELPFSVKPDTLVDVRRVMELFRSTYEGTAMDMCQNVLINDSTVSPIANPWLTTTMRNTLNQLHPDCVEFRRTVAVSWCAYSHITQLRSWLPDAIGGVCWLSVDNPAQSPRIPVFCGTTRLPMAFDRCGQNGYDEQSALWQFRRTNRLATLQWQSTKALNGRNVADIESFAFDGIRSLEADVANADADYTSAALNAFTQSVFDRSTACWKKMEENLWMRFWVGF